MRLSVWSVVKSVTAFVLLGGIAVGVWAGYHRLPGLLRDLAAEKTAPVVAGKEVIVTIPKGASLSQVGDILQQTDVIGSRFVFKLVAFIRGEQRKIKAGDYALKTGSDPGEVLDQLISGKTCMLTFTVPEGYDMYQVAEIVHQNGIVDKDPFLAAVQDKALMKELGIAGQSAEGYLFPDTYTIRHSEKGDPKLVIRKMAQRFREVYDKHVKIAAEASGWSASQVITLASLIEKEAKASEHPLVSAVFHNRLRENMKLQSDPTVIYGIKPMGAKITKEDLNRKHPYNTYQNFGLPPGPIANPGKESLVAAVKPADVDYTYFVAKNDGSHQFSNSLKEHNKWVNLFQRNKGELQTQ